MGTFLHGLALLGSTVSSHVTHNSSRANSYTLRMPFSSPFLASICSLAIPGTEMGLFGSIDIHACVAVGQTEDTKKEEF